jgi:hypothetical protein
MPIGTNRRYHAVKLLLKIIQVIITVISVNKLKETIRTFC